jgi:hypothetical protein
MAITDEVRKYGETVLEQGKVALDEARKPLYAVVGAGEQAVGQLVQLPAEVQARLRSARQLDPAAVRTAVGNAAGAYGTYARETYDSLAHRGELVVRRLRRSEVVENAFDATEDVVADAGQAVAEAEAKVTKPGRTTTRKPAAARTAPARKAPAKRTSTS